MHKFLQFAVDPTLTKYFVLHKLVEHLDVDLGWAYYYYYCYYKPADYITIYKTKGHDHVVVNVQLYNFHCIV